MPFASSRAKSVTLMPSMNSVVSTRSVERSLTTTGNLISGWPAKFTRNVSMFRASCAKSSSSRMSWLMSS